MKIKSLEINNILSIEDAHIEFQDNGLILLEGFNYDANRGNGSGKTAIFNALSFALFDKVPRKITKTEIKRNDAKTAYAFCTLDVNGDMYTVKRYRPTKVDFFKNGEPLLIEQEEFEKKIDMSYDQFLITMYTAQDEYNKRFLSLNDKSKKDFILELMKLDKFNFYNKKCKDLLKELEHNKEKLSIELTGIKNNIFSMRNSLEDENGITAVITSNNVKKQELQASIAALRDTRRPNTEKYETIREQARREKARLSELKNAKYRATAEINSLDKNKRVFTPHSNAECPNCNKPLFNVNGKLLKNDDIETMKKECDNNNHTIEQQQELLKNKIIELDSMLLKEVEIDVLLSKVNDRQQADLLDYNKAQSNILLMENQIKSLDQINISYQRNIERNKTIKDSLNVLIDREDKINTKIESLLEEKTVIESVNTIFASTGAPAHIMEDFVDNFNEIIQDNISLIWGNASYTLQTHKVNSDDKVTAKFSELLIIDSKEVSIGSLSGGEYRSLSLAADFAILDVLERQFGINLCPIICDEPFNGLDSVGRETVIDLLKTLSEKRQIWVVDHASEAKSMFSKVVRVEKRNGISKIVV